MRYSVEMYLQVMNNHHITDDFVRIESSILTQILRMGAQYTFPRETSV